MYIVVDAPDELKGSEATLNRRQPFLNKIKRLRAQANAQSLYWRPVDRTSTAFKNIVPKVTRLNSRRT